MVVLAQRSTSPGFGTGHSKCRVIDWGNFCAVTGSGEKGNCLKLRPKVRHDLLWSEDLAVAQRRPAR